MTKILIADHADFIRKHIASFLLMNGYEVILAENGCGAVQAYRAFHPDVVLMDVSMPGMDGISALKKIFEVDSAARIIMMTALGQESMALEAVRSGAKDVILKPFEESRVVNSIAKLLG